jgi:hypothetical protein
MSTGTGGRLPSEGAQIISPGVGSARAWIFQPTLDKELICMSDVPKNDEFDKREFEYVAPEDGQKWRARDLVDIHWRLIPCSINCPDSVRPVLSSLIGHANPATGQLNPRQKIIGYETGYSRMTVNLAIKWLVKHSFLRADQSGQAAGRAGLYAVNWDFTDFLYYMIAQTSIGWSTRNGTLFNVCHDTRCCLHEDKADYYTEAEIAAWTSVASGGVNSEVYRGCKPQALQGVSTPGFTGGVKTDFTTETLIEPIIETQMEDIGPSSDGPPPESYLVDIKKVEEALQGEQEAKPSPLSEGRPTEGEIQTIVWGYCGPDWEQVPPEDFEAAMVAETEEPGAGRAIITASLKATLKGETG